MDNEASGNAMAAVLNQCHMQTRMVIAHLDANECLVDELCAIDPDIVFTQFILALGGPVHRVTDTWASGVGRQTAVDWGQATPADKPVIKIFL